MPVTFMHAFDVTAGGETMGRGVRGGGDGMGKSTTDSRRAVPYSLTRATQSSAQIGRA